MSRILALVLILLYSCKSDVDHLYIPENLFVYNTKNKNSEKFVFNKNADSDFLIFPIDVSCASCISYFDIWNSYTELLKEKNLHVLLILSSTDKFRLFNFYYETQINIDDSFMLLIDSTGDYSKSNSVYLNAIIVNSNKEIVDFTKITSPNDIKSLIDNHQK